MRNLSKAVRGLGVVGSIVLVSAVVAPRRADPAPRADFTVNSTADRADESAGDGLCTTGQTTSGVAECTLRAALQEVNAQFTNGNTQTYRIAVPAGTYALTLSSACDFKSHDDPNVQTFTAATLCIRGNVILSGDDASTTIIDAGNQTRAMYVSADVSSTITNFTVQHGMQSGGSIIGGGVYNAGTLLVQNSTFRRNQGAALFSYTGSVSIVESLFDGNFGTAVPPEGEDNGGAIRTASTVFQLLNSSVVNNTALTGAGLALYDSQSLIINSTISNNRTSQAAGGVNSRGLNSTLTLNNVTVAGNTAQIEGGVATDQATLSNTILANNGSDDCVVKRLTSLGYNLIQTANFAGLCQGGDGVNNIVGKDATLGPLQADVGVMPTRVPLAGSPAIGAGSPQIPGAAGAGACTAFDERGTVRGGARPCTIGAVATLAHAFTVQSAAAPHRGGWRAAGRRCRHGHEGRNAERFRDRCTKLCDRSAARRSE